MKRRGRLSTAHLDAFDRALEWAALDSQEPKIGLIHIRGRRTHVLAALIAITLVGGCGDSESAGLAETEAGAAALVVRYCIYGSASRAQADGCDDHVSAEEVAERALADNPTNAALYATGEITECRADAGPGCTPGETFEETKVILEQLGEASN